METLASLSKETLSSAEEAEVVLIEARERITDIDQTIAQLLAERLEVAGAIGDAKRVVGKTILDTEREREVMSGFVRTAEGLGVPPTLARGIITSVILASRQAQYATPRPEVAQ